MLLINSDRWCRWYFHVVITCVAASNPTVKSNGCVLEDKNVSLTCEVAYNGTNLMPLQMLLTKYTQFPPVRDYYFLYRPSYRFYYKPYYINSINTANASSVHQATFTFTATGPTTDICMCRVSFSSPTGLVLPGVQQQSTSTTGRFMSSVFHPQRVESEILVYV